LLAIFCAGVFLRKEKALSGEMSKKHFKICILGLASAGILIYTILGCSKNGHNAYRIEKPAAKLNIHLPFAEGYCTQCHLPSGFSDSKKSSREEPAFSIETTAMPNPWRLVLPVDQLCMKCHGYDISEKTFAGKLWIHAPSAQGACIICHSAHHSENPYLLRNQSLRLCADRCHLEGYMMEVKVHQGSRECIECHNPHVGINALMLKKDYREVWLKPKRTWINK